MNTSHRILAAIAFLLATVSCITHSLRSSRKPAAAAFFSGYDFETSFDRRPEATITCPEFFELISNAKPQPDTVEAALKILKAAKPDYFNYYTLLPNSESMHGSSWQFPRALVYGGDGGMVTTFNGHKNQVGYGEIEVMCTDPKTSKFEFRDIIFPKEAEGDMLELTAEEAKQPFIIGEAGGKFGFLRDCRDCHESPARPNWDTYNQWPAAYGANDDHPFRKDSQDEDLYKRVAAMTKIELAAWKTFSATGRYGVLGKNADRTNTRVGHVFALRNAERIVSELKALGPKFLAIKTEFTKALYCPVSGVEKRTFENPSRNGGFSGISMNVLMPPVDPAVKKILLEMRLYQLQKEARMTKIFGAAAKQESDPIDQFVADYYKGLGFTADEAKYVGWQSVGFAIRLAKMEKLLAPLGIHIKNWSLVRGGGYSFEDGSEDPSNAALSKVLDVPYLMAFYPDNVRLHEKVENRRRTANSALDAEVCAEIE